ncbi:MAG: SLC13 family permease [Cyclobacteriaceae bacterium]|nr:SLC13 family permease [Cyclobacteriaceae bacterium]MDH4297224.1 SLC13 family permease [Cyclobacteriaceae bacterium]MDH5251254.1 SLC13 family permease [Cyclobacteriaceae bacterium]
MFTKEKLGLFAGPIAFVIIQNLSLVGLPSAGQAILASTTWIAIWWITEALPMSATALLPIILFPLTGGMDIETTTTTYYSPLIMLFLGGFVIAIAIERWNLHQRIALNIIKAIGTNSSRIVLGFMVATAFLSMWISNTATALMMLPIGLAITHKMGEFQNQRNDRKALTNFKKSLMLAIAYSASIGGMATLIGSPTNAIFSAVSVKMFEQEITFFDWFSFGFPFAIILLFIGWVYLTKIAFRTQAGQAKGAKEEIDNNLRSFGKMSYEEKMVSLVFAFTATAWILRSFVLELFLPGINDTVIAIFGALILFVIPSKVKGVNLMDWESASKLPWGILILFGGGLAIAVAFRQSGLALWLGEKLSSMEQFHFALILFVVIIMVNFFTEITSNVATAAVMLPILASLSQSIGVHPFGLMMGASIASSCAFMLPVATPPNAIVYSSSLLSMDDMVRSGFWMNIISSCVLFFFIYYLLPFILEIDLMVYPF